MSEETKPFSWMAMIRNIGLALVMFAGGGTGSYVSMQEMAKDEALFRAEVRLQLNIITDRLETLESKSP